MLQVNIAALTELTRLASISEGAKRSWRDQSVLRRARRTNG
jgi:hypothetical protein